MSSDSVQHALKQELPKYVAASEGVSESSNIDRLGWWKKHELDLPHWSRACKVVLLIQPLQQNDCIHSCQTVLEIDRQTSSREDYIEMVILQYNSQ